MRRISGSGTPERHWRPWLARGGMPRLQVPPPVERAEPRAVFLAAHPDDEVLGAGGLLHLLARHGWQVDLVWASDGEASHPRSTTVTPAELAARRRRESTAARAVLGLAGRTVRLGLPDSGLHVHEERLRERLDEVAAGADLLLAPWREDGHPDHETCGRAAAAVAERHALPLWEVPIWAWHWGEATELAPRWQHVEVLDLDLVTRRTKAVAIDQFTSQTRPLGPGPDDAPVLGEEVLARFRRDVEVMLVTTPGQGRAR